MPRRFRPDLDLTPPGFAEGLDDWSRGDGTPDSPTYEAASHARLVPADPDFGVCLELRKVEPVQRLRYMGELPIQPECRVEIAVRLKVLKGPLPMVRIAAWPGGAHGRRIEGLPSTGPAMQVTAQGVIETFSGVIGCEPGPGIDLVWDHRPLYAHVGIDLLGLNGSVLRLENLSVRSLPWFGQRLRSDGMRRSRSD
jgi:hypothetical protein